MSASSRQFVFVAHGTRLRVVRCVVYARFYVETGTSCYGDVARDNVAHACKYRNVRSRAGRAQMLRKARAIGTLLQCADARARVMRLDAEFGYVARLGMDIKSFGLPRICWRILGYALRIHAPFRSRNAS